MHRTSTEAMQRLLSTARRRKTLAGRQAMLRAQAIMQGKRNAEGLEMTPETTIPKKPSDTGIAHNYYRADMLFKRIYRWATQGRLIDDTGYFTLQQCLKLDAQDTGLLAWGGVYRQYYGKLFEDALARAVDAGFLTWIGGDMLDSDGFHIRAYKFAGEVLEHSISPDPHKRARYVPQLDMTRPSPPPLPSLKRSATDSYDQGRLNRQRVASRAPHAMDARYTFPVSDESVPANVLFDRDLFFSSYEVTEDNATAFYIPPWFEFLMAGDGVSLARIEEYLKDSIQIMLHKDRNDTVQQAANVYRQAFIETNQEKLQAFMRDLFKKGCEKFGIAEPGEGESILPACRELDRNLDPNRQIVRFLDADVQHRLIITTNSTFANPYATDVRIYTANATSLENYARSTAIFPHYNARNVTWNNNWRNPKTRVWCIEHVATADPVALRVYTEEIHNQLTATVPAEDLAVQLQQEGLGAEQRRGLMDLRQMAMGDTYRLAELWRANVNIEPQAVLAAQGDGNSFDSRVFFRFPDGRLDEDTLATRMSYKKDGTRLAYKHNNRQIGFLYEDVNGETMPLYRFIGDQFGANITDIAFSPSGDLFAAASRNTIEVFVPGAGAQGPPSLFLDNEVWPALDYVSFSWISDERIVAVTSKEITMWNSQDGTVVWSKSLPQFELHTFTKVMRVPDGETIAAIKEDFVSVPYEAEPTQIKFYSRVDGDDLNQRLNLDTLPPLQRAPENHQCKIAFSPDGSAMAYPTRSLSMGNDGVVGIWHLAICFWKRGGPPGRNILLAPSNLYSRLIWHAIIWSPNGALVACMTSPAEVVPARITVDVFDIAGKKLIGKVTRTLNTIFVSPSSILWSPDSKQITYRTDQEIMLWSIPSPHKAMNFIYDDSQDHLRLGNQGTYNLSNYLQAFGDSSDVGKVVCYSPDGRHIVNTFGHYLHVRDANTLELTHILDAASFAEAVRYSEDGSQLIVTTSDARMAQIYSTDNWEELGFKFIRPLNGIDRVIVRSPDNQYFAVAYKHQEELGIQIWSGEQAANGQYNGQALGEPLRLRDYEWFLDEEFTTMAFSPDSRRLAVGSRRGKVRIWNVEDRQLIFNDRVHDENVKKLVFSPDGSAILTTGTHIAYFGHHINPETGEDDGELMLDIDITNITTHQLVFAATRPYENMVPECFSPDGTRFLVQNNDTREAEVWTVAPPDKIMSWPRNFDENAACFSPDGSRVVSFSMRNVSMPIIQVTEVTDQPQLIYQPGYVPPPDGAGPNAPAPQQPNADRSYAELLGVDDQSDDEQPDVETSSESDDEVIVDDSDVDSSDEDESGARRVRLSPPPERNTRPRSMQALVTLLRGVSITE